VTLIGKQETYYNLTSAYQIMKLWHAYIDSSFERVFFNTRSIEDQDPSRRRVAAPPRRRVATSLRRRVALGA